MGTSRPQARAWWVVFGLWLVFMAEPFYGLGMTTQDQVIWALRGTSDDFWGWVFKDASHHGRVRFLFAKAIDQLTSSYPDLFLTRAAVFSFFVLSAPALAFALFERNEARVLFVWIFFCLSWVGYHHLPPAAYPIVDHLPMFSLSVSAWLLRRLARRTRVGWAPGTALFMLGLFSFFQYEPMTVFSCLVFGFVILKLRFDSPRVRRRVILLVSSALFVYLVLAFVFSALSPSTYAGLSRGTLNPITLLRTWMAFSLGALPPLHSEWAPNLALQQLEANDAHVFYEPFGIPGGLGCAFAVAGAVAVWRILTSSPPTSSRAAFAGSWPSRSSRWGR